MIQSISATRPSRRAAIAIGVVAGALSGLFGIGGGILVVPALVTVGRMEQRLAHGTSLLAAAPLGLAGMIGYTVGHSVDWSIAGLLLAGSIVGTFIGTRLLRRLAHRTLQLGFAALLVVTAIRMLIQVPGGAGRGPLHLSTVSLMLVIGVFTGALAGLMGVGGGVLMVPAQNIILDIPSAIAKGTSLAVIVPTAIIGSVQNLRHGNADLTTGATIGISGVVPSYFLSQVSIGMNARLSTVLFAVLLVFSASRLMAKDR
jgi:uncharacterized membrane protein YfcA